MKINICLVRLLCFSETMFIAIRDILIRRIGFHDIFRGLKWLGINNIELALNKKLEAIAFSNVDLSSLDSLSEFASKLKENEVNICALLLANDFGSENISSEINYVKNGVEIAKRLGVKVVRVNAIMKPKPSWTLEDMLSITVNSLKSALSSDSAVWLAVENHGIVSNRKEFLRGLFKMVKGLSIGLTLDTCNFYWYGYPLNEVYEMYGEFAKYVKHTHVKNATSIGPKNSYRKYGSVKMQPLYEGDIDLERTIQILRENGYDYDLTIEDESLERYSIEDRRKILLKDIEFLRKILKK